ncbi:MAG: hypothetical protein GXO79_13795 [Chlorobi bacterium]|nr:hypothetical protein [Chlorobiota bacterium]
MKKLLLSIAVIAFIGIISVPVDSFATTNPTVVLDDPPTSKEANSTKTTTETTKETTQENATKSTEKDACKKDYSKDNCKKDMSKSSCCKKDKK